MGARYTHRYGLLWQEEEPSPLWWFYALQNLAELSRQVHIAVQVEATVDALQTCTPILPHAPFCSKYQVKSVLMLNEKIHHGITYSRSRLAGSRIRSRSGENPSQSETEPVAIRKCYISFLILSLGL